MLVDKDFADFSFVEDCPKCLHAWSRHHPYWAGFVCRVRSVDASGNFDGCGCDEKPPQEKR